MKRRTWDLNEYKNKQQKEEKKKLVYTKKEDRISTTFDLNLERAVGRKAIVDTQLAGFVCKVCDEIFTNSQAYLEHINSRKHQIAAGITDKPEMVSLQAVLDRIEYWKNKEPDSLTMDSIKNRIAERKEEIKKKRKFK